MKVTLSWSFVPGSGMATSMKIFDGMEHIKGHHKTSLTKLQF